MNADLSIGSCMDIRKFSMNDIRTAADNTYVPDPYKRLLWAGICMECGKI